MSLAIVGCGFHKGVETADIKDKNVDPSRRRTYPWFAGNQPLPAGFRGFAEGLAFSALDPLLLLS